MVFPIKRRVRATPRGFSARARTPQPRKKSRRCVPKGTHSMSSMIITHDGAFAQAKRAPNLQPIPQSGPPNRILTDSGRPGEAALTPIQQSAYQLYDAGFNVFPLPGGRKSGYPWKRLQYSRLVRDHHHLDLGALFVGSPNVAVMCGRTSSNLFVIDCETPDAFTQHLREMRQRNIPIWAAQTARGGHIYLRCESGEVENVEPGVMCDAEIKGRQGYVLAPPSLHPTGVRYAWLLQEGNTPPTVETSQINWLKDRRGNQVHLSVIPVNDARRAVNWRLSLRDRGISKRTRDYLQNGHSLAEGSRNDRLFAAACDLNGNQYSETDAQQLLEPVAKNSGLSQHEIRRTIASAYSQQRGASREYYKERNKTTQTNSSQPNHWEHALYFAVQHMWQGRSQMHQRTLFLAMVECSRRSGNENGTFRASIRELAELTRMGTGTIQKLLKRLLKDQEQLLFHAGYDRTSRASLWQFSKHVLRSGKDIQLKTDTSPLPPHWISFSVSVFNSDASERGALGLSGLYLYCLMLSQGRALMPSKWAEVSGLTINQVNYALRKLRQHGLVERVDAGWCCVPLTTPVDEVLEEVAARVGKSGVGRRRRQRFARERQIFNSNYLFAVRAHREGRSYWDAVRQWRHVRQQAEAVAANVSQNGANGHLPAQNVSARLERDLFELLTDPLIEAALELGGQLELPNGQIVDISLYRHIQVECGVNLTI